jgi:hypothetical protein
MGNNISNNKFNEKIVRRIIDARKLNVKFMYIFFNKPISKKIMTENKIIYQSKSKIKESQLHDFVQTYKNDGMDLEYNIGCEYIYIKFYKLDTNAYHENIDGLTQVSHPSAI